VTDDEIRSAIDDPAARQDTTAVALTEAFLARIAVDGSRLRAMITVTDELALADARRVDEARARGARLPLDGMALVVKDNVDLAGVRTTIGSRQFADRIADEDAPVVERLRRAGAVTLGKANMHEVAFGATSLNHAFGAVVNPWDDGIIAGGSSGGSGAAVAADLCIGAIGTDTGGSVRIPASCCGVSGLRPTFGAVSTRGVFPVSWTLDTVGPLARAVDDVAALHAAMAGFDPDDPRSIERPLPKHVDEPLSVAGLRVGIPHGFFFEQADAEIAAAVLAAADALVGLGARLVEIALPGAADAAAACGPIVWAEALAVHRDRLDSSPELFEDGTRRRLALARSLTAVDLALLQQRMFDWQRTIRRVFESADVLLTPTLPVAPPAVEEAETIATTARVVPFTFPFSLARTPALSLPCGFTEGGHPIGLQLVAPWWRDELVLGVGAAYQRSTDWHRRRPPA
jgi:aspartyl-tRNA(Asn)/glutamyl-tRNA(Gln) amidotransferase subunit A